MKTANGYTPEPGTPFDMRRKPPEWAKDVVTNRTTVYLSFWDRVKVLFGYVLTVETATATEVAPGLVKTVSGVSVTRSGYLPASYVVEKESK